MKPLVCTGLAVSFAIAASGLQFNVYDARGRQTSAVTLSAGDADQDGWHEVQIAKSKGDVVLIWPFDGRAKTPDGPEPVSAIVIHKADEKGLTNKATVAALATPVLMGASSMAEIAQKSGYPEDRLQLAFAELATASDAWQKGLGLLFTGKAKDAAAQLGLALRERQRQLTRVPSDIYPAAVVHGRALLKANQFDDAAVAFLTAMKLRPSSELAAKARDEALIKAGKAEAAGR
jgi:hypothetical protein